MREAWQLSPYFFEIITINFGGDDALLIRCARNDLPPRVDNHRVAVVGMAVDIFADLVWRDHIRLVFDRAGTKQRFPMGGTGRKSERRRDEQHFCSSPCELSVQFGKAKVVTHRETEDAQWGVLHDDLRAGFHRR